ncbi:MAG: SUMF1/EgtB/PvdO family nonheme iron enzyme [Deltaproteobacteria bacterium]|nr:SUMF1/EgtB/PvdO family nonheme iron enzyme [Deltaproteobacteria bacterium]
MTSVWHPGSKDPSPEGQDPPRVEPVTGEHVESLLATGLDRYALTRLLGVGGMGEVYLGIHRTIEKEVAVKVLAYQHRHDPSLNGRFLEEAKAASKIRHDHVVDITDFGHSPQGCSYFVMEYLQGEDLAATLSREGPLPWTRARHLVLQLLSALQAAHDLGIVHRDIKPANCLRSKKRDDPDFIKVLDFGIARVSGPTSDGPRLTKAGTIMGTAEYMAPEQARADEVDARTDLYAVGVMLFEMLTGTLPFAGKAPVEILSKHLFHEPPRPSEIASNNAFPPEFDNIILRALAKDPAERWSSAEHMAEAIEAVDARADSKLAKTMMATAAHGAPGLPSGPMQYSTTEPPGPQTNPAAAAAAATGPQPIPSSRGRLDILGAGLAVVAVGGLLWWATRDGDDPAESTSKAAAVATACPEGMVQIDGGTFFMGSDDVDTPALQGARPSHKVEVATYCMATHETTVDQFHECSDQGQCRRPFKEDRYPNDSDDRRAALSLLCNEGVEGRGNHPVNCITWKQAKDYCEFRGQRLPTEAEWEFAARGSDGRVFPWGDPAPTHEHGNLCNAECVKWRASKGLPEYGALSTTDDGFPGTAPVGSFPAGTTQHGLLDIVGNVFEWTADRYAPYEGSPADAPSGGGKVIRGGAFNSYQATFANPALRYEQVGTAHTQSIGFRCAADPVSG